MKVWFCESKLSCWPEFHENMSWCSIICWRGIYLPFRINQLIYFILSIFVSVQKLPLFLLSSLNSLLQFQFNVFFSMISLIAKNCSWWTLKPRVNSKIIFFYFDFFTFIIKPIFLSRVFFYFLFFFLPTTNIWNLICQTKKDIVLFDRKKFDQNSQKCFVLSNRSVSEVTEHNELATA